MIRRVWRWFVNRWWYGGRRRCPHYWMNMDGSHNYCTRTLGHFGDHDDGKGLYWENRDV